MLYNIICYYTHISAAKIGIFFYMTKYFCIFL